VRGRQPAGSFPAQKRTRLAERWWKGVHQTGTPTGSLPDPFQGSGSCPEWGAAGGWWANSSIGGRRWQSAVVNATGRPRPAWGRRRWPGS